MAGSCKSYCYALQGRYITPPVKRARQHNLSVVRDLLREGSEELASALVSDLESRRLWKSVRVHDSGDFFTQEYLDAWYMVAKRLDPKGFRFYAYTKSLNLDLWSGKPSNFVIIQSEGGKLDHLIDYDKPHSRIYPTTQDISGGYADGSETDYHAMNGETRIGLVYHGVKNLTENQIKKFQKYYNKG